MVLLGATSEVGFTRDESFYFEYSGHYQDWFSRVASPPDDDPDPLGRADVVGTWSENSEHPPLVKVLFGASWRAFGDKRRPVDEFRVDPEDGSAVRARIGRLSDADGFAPGDEVALYGPIPVDGDRSDEARLLATGTIVERERREAALRIQGTELAELVEICAEPEAEEPGEPHPWIAGCRVSSSGPLQFLDEASAMRLVGWAFAGLLVALLYLFGLELFGRWAGLFGALAFLLIPRPFFHAHLASFDVPVTAMIVATVYAWWKSLRSRAWAWIAAVVWGLALLTKLNAFFVPFPLLFAWLFPALLRRRWPDLPLAFVLMPPIGALLFFGLWPRMWYDPAQAFHSYASFHASHVHYLQQYFGHILSAPPFPASFPWVLTALTVPLVLLGLFAVGTVVLLWIERARTTPLVKCLLVGNLLLPILLISMPSTPIFGGVKHWLVTLAFGALLAGVGFDWLRRKTMGHPLATLALTAALLAPGAVESVASAEVGTSYYNALAGGIRGAADRRMHRQFWGYAGRYGLEHVNANAPRHSNVAFHNTTWGATAWYKRVGLLRDDIRWRRDPGAGCRGNDSFYLFHHQESFAQDRIDAWQRLGVFAPEQVVTASGVPILSVYRCAERAPRHTGRETPPSPQTPRAAPPPRPPGDRSSRSRRRGSANRSSAPPERAPPRRPASR